MLTTEQPIRKEASFRDPSGFVFELEDRIFRAINQPCLELMEELQASGLLAELADDNFIVRTHIVDDPILLEQLRETYPDYSAFLEHERIDFISYPYEWSASMLADAGILTLDLQMRLLENGYSLKDATAYNIQFVNGKPIFIDIPSIEKPARLDVWIGLGQFGRMFVLPLLLNRYRGQNLRSYFLANLDGCDVAEARKAFGRLELLKPELLLDVTLPYWLGRIGSGNDHSPKQIERKKTSPQAQMMNLKRLKGKLQKLSRRGKSTSVWADYKETCSYSDKSEQSKVNAIQQFMADYRPQSVLDIGCNTGQYSMLAAEFGARVFSVDSDSQCVELLYRHTRNSNLPILPMCVDIANPSPAIGFCNRERISFLDRIDIDCIFALAVIHHLHVSANLPLAGIRDLFAEISNDYLILEFVPTDDVMFRRLMQFRVDLFEDFTLDNCINIFSEQFNLLDQVAVQDSPRTLLFWQKKRA